MPKYTARFSYDDVVTRTTRSARNYTHAFQIYATGGHVVADGFCTSEGRAYATAASTERKLVREGFSIRGYEVVQVTEDL